MSFVAFSSFVFCSLIISSSGVKAAFASVAAFSNFPKFAFVPEKAYSDGKSSVKGLVVDLQDVIQFDIKVKNPILAYEYDYKVEKSKEKREYINNYFFFDSDSDFVIAENVIASPWIEYVLQMFANSFMRIGVDNALEYEIEDFCMEILGDNK